VRIWIAASVLSFLLAVPAWADQVTLKNGDRLTGTISKSDGKALVIKTDYAGDVTVKFDAIQGITSAGDLQVVSFNVVFKREGGNHRSGRVCSRRRCSTIYAESRRIRHLGAAVRAKSHLLTLAFIARGGGLEPDRPGSPSGPANSTP